MTRRFRLLNPRTQDSSIDWLVTQFRESLHLEDPGPLYILMGAIAANLMEGDPVWLMLVGPASAGKTELLNSVLKLRGVFECASITNEAAFLSATAKRERSQNATGGLLRQVGDHGAVVINDFTSVLSLDQKDMKKILGVFRECYQGRWTRHVGSEGGRQMQWVGKVAFLAGVTGVIDRSHELAASLGERWLYYRLAEDDDDANHASHERTRRRMINTAGQDWRDELKRVVEDFFETECLKFGELEARRDLTDTEIRRLMIMAKVGAKCRSAVVRDSRTREIITPRETEQETRLSVVLGQLLLGMERVGVVEKERWRVLGKSVLDSMPRLRSLVIKSVKKGESAGDLVRVEQLAKAFGCSRSTVDRTVEDLEVHGIVQREKDEGRVSIHLTDWMRRKWKAGWHQ
jgi:hypothetical protein